jgi:hypothetical protein
MALKGKEESKAIFKEIVGTALGALIENLARKPWTSIRG